jgi:hypothetical protein
MQKKLLVVESEDQSLNKEAQMSQEKLSNGKFSQL